MPTLKYWDETSQTYVPVAGGMSQETADVRYLQPVQADAKYVLKTGDEAITGVKTFTSSPVLPGDADASLEAVPLQQVQAMIDAAIAAAVAQIAQVPTGTIAAWARSSANPPAGWLLCNGQAVSRTTYAALFAVCGEAYGPGDASTTFNVPDFSDRFPIGFSGYGPVGTKGGAATHTLTEAEMPSHIHTQSAHDHQPYAWVGNYLADSPNLDDIPGSGNRNTASPVPMGNRTDAAQPAIQAAGGNAAHNNMPPYQVTLFIIRA